MKMYEKLGIDPTTKEGILKIATILCEDIPDDLIDPNEPCPTEDCVKCRIDRLFSEVPTKKMKRWEKYNGDFLEAASEHSELFCNGASCYNADLTCKECFANWLMEEIEVEDNGD